MKNVFRRAAKPFHIMTWTTDADRGDWSYFHSAELANLIRGLTAFLEDKHGYATAIDFKGKS